jgi:predicted DNA-binding mobile mystery protein A
MKKEYRQIMLKELDKKLLPFEEASKIIKPNRGWIYAIRTTLGMTLKQLSSKLEKSESYIQKVEDNEAKGVTNLKTLHEVAEAMDLKLVYGFVPKGKSFEQLVLDRAREVARKIVKRTHHNMTLEDQAINSELLKQQIEDLARSITREGSSEIWD